MRRVVSLYLPSWPTDRLRRLAGDNAPPADAPMMVVGRDGAKRLVTAADTAAMALGVRVGMPAAKAQALVAGLVIRDRE